MHMFGKMGSRAPNRQLYSPSRLTTSMYPCPEFSHAAFTVLLLASHSFTHRSHLLLTRLTRRIRAFRCFFGLVPDHKREVLMSRDEVEGCCFCNDSMVMALLSQDAQVLPVWEGATNIVRGSRAQYGSGRKGKRVLVLISKSVHVHTGTC